MDGRLRTADDGTIGPGGDELIAPALQVGVVGQDQISIDRGLIHQAAKGNHQRDGFQGLAESDPRRQVVDWIGAVDEQDVNLSSTHARHQISQFGKAGKVARPADPLGRHVSPQEHAALPSQAAHDHVQCHDGVHGLIAI